MAKPRLSAFRREGDLRTLVRGSVLRFGFLGSATISRDVTGDQPNVARQGYTAAFDLRNSASGVVWRRCRLLVMAGGVGRSMPQVTPAKVFLESASATVPLRSEVDGGRL